MYFNFTKLIANRVIVLALFHAIITDDDAISNSNNVRDVKTRIQPDIGGTVSYILFSSIAYQTARLMMGHRGHVQTVWHQNVY